MCVKQSRPSSLVGTSQVAQPNPRFAFVRGVQIPLNHFATGIHLRFHRETSEPRMSLGMPNLKRFARPTDWPDLHRALTMFVKGASDGGRTLSGLPPHATLSPIFLRLPGNQGCTIKSSTVLFKGTVE